MKKIFIFLAIILSFMNLTKGSQLIIGLPWNDVIFWRYWQSENGILNEKIIILNERNESISTSFMIAKVESNLNYVKAVTDSSLGIVGGPWQIPGNGYKIFYMPKLPDSIEANHSYLYQVFCNDKSGLMEIHNTKPIGSFPQTRILTNMAVNGGFDNKGDFWCEHISLFATSGEKVKVRFSFIPRMSDPKEKDNAISIKFRNSPDSISNNPYERLKLITAERGNFPIESKIESPESKERWKSLTITFPSYNENLKYIDPYYVDFVLEAPQTTSPKLHSFGIFLMIGGSNDDYFRIPLIVLPK